MKSFSPSDVAAQRKDFVLNRYQSGIAQFGGKQVEYFVLPNNLNLALPNFAFRMTGKKNEPMLFGVSIGVPTERKRFWVAHEYHEFTELPESPDSCLKALEYELQLVDDGQFKEHVQERAGFFNALVPYLEAEKTRIGAYTSEDIERVAKSKDRLNAIIRTGFKR